MNACIHQSDGRDAERLARAGGSILVVASASQPHLQLQLETLKSLARYLNISRSLSLAHSFFPLSRYCAAR